MSTATSNKPPIFYESSGRTPGTFIDVFAGCGGLSLGLMRAGWKGLFAVERDQFAFETLRTNLLDSGTARHQFAWPQWLSKAPTCVMTLLEKHAEQLGQLAGKVDLMAGGPPCQGFSSAGRRVSSDPRNSLMNGYLALVRMVRPRIVLIENVHGITVDFVDKKKPDSKVNYAEILIGELSADYHVFWRTINVAEFGVPQGRKRFFLIAQRKEFLPDRVDPFPLLERNRAKFLSERKIWAQMSSSAAISDLEVARNDLVACPDSVGFSAIGYSRPRTNYQKLMREGCSEAPNSTRLAKHRPEIALRFKKIISICHELGRLNVSLSKELRDSLGLKKMALRVLDPERPSPTITSMPDDLLHYKEARTLTVRETARLQSFPDWFEFRGKYTTGGHLRKKEVPRFTQVANAVPPLMAEAIGHALHTWKSGPVALAADHVSAASTKVAMV